MNKSWTTDDARHTYAIANWGEGYFDVGADGAVLVKPRAADGPAISLPAVVEAARGVPPST